MKVEKYLLLLLSLIKKITFKKSKIAINYVALQHTRAAYQNEFVTHSVAGLMTTSRGWYFV